MQHDLQTYLDTVERLQRHRGVEPSPVLTDTATALYHFFGQALQDSQAGLARMQVAAAPTGSGKSTATVAYTFHLWRTRGKRSLILVPTTAMAEDTWRNLKAVFEAMDATMDFWMVTNVYTTVHRHDVPHRDRLAALQQSGLTGLPTNPKIERETMGEFPILVATHALWTKSPNAWRAMDDRDVVIVDEWVDKINTHQVDLGDLDWLLSWHDRKAEGRRQAVSDDLRTLADFLRQTYEGLKDTPQRGVFVPVTSEGETACGRIARLWKTDRGEYLKPLFHQEGHTAGNTQEALDARLERVFGFVTALHEGQVFKERFKNDEQLGASFIGYTSCYDIFPGLVLLDATGQLDGISQIVSWRHHGDVRLPRIDYGALRPRILDKPTALNKKTADETLRDHDLLEAWRDWVRWLVRTKVKATDKALIILPKKLIGHVPGDLQAEFTDLSITNWGRHTGSNEWRDCNVVFLLDQFYRPRSVQVAHVRGLQGSPEDRRPTASNLKDANHGALKGQYQTYRDGQQLAAIIQGASRGTMRQVDKDGRCGPMRLYVAGPVVQVHEQLKEGFPGAPEPKLVSFDEGTRETLKSVRGAAPRLIEAFIRLQAAGVLEVDIDQLVEWTGLKRPSARKALKEDATVQTFMDKNGWALVITRGQNGSITVHR